MNSILITGCNRGLGLGLVRVLTKLPTPPQHLFATCRNLEKATELREVAAANPNVHILEIDLNNTSAYEDLVNRVDQVTQTAGLNVLFNNAGVAAKSTRINVVREEDLVENLRVNTIAPILLTKAFLPLLKKASKANENQGVGVRRAAIINMSSILGSIGGNTDGGMYAYRTSKAAINAATKSLSIDLSQNKILCVSLHPGWVKTDMGGPKAPLDVDTATSKMVETILNFNEAHNGGFYQYNGKQLPW